MSFIDSNGLVMDFCGDVNAWCFHYALIMRSIDFHCMVTDDGR